MNDFSCCSSCSTTSAGSVFPLGSYLPYQPGYGHSFGSFNPVGVAGPNMGIPVARPYPSAEPLPIASGPNPYRRGDGRANPYFKLPTFNGFSNYAVTGDPATFNPLSNYAGTGNPCGFNPVSAYPSASNPMGSISPVGESLPANIGHPTRIGNGVGGTDAMGSWYNDNPFNPIF
jgi:hypothetical protein